MPENAVSITVKPTFGELYKLNLFLYLRVFRYFLIPIALAGLLLLILLIFAWVSPSAAEPTKTIFEGLGSFPYFVLGTPIFFVLLPALVSQKSVSAMKPYAGTVFTISQESVEIKAPKAESKVNWTAFISARETRDAILLFVAKGSAYPLPKRCFGDPSEINFVRDVIRSRIPKSKLQV